MTELTQHSYRRLTQNTSSLLDQSISDVNRSFEEGGYSQEVTEFDYRQTLHMECGVVALEPPPSYTVAMKELGHQLRESSRERGVSEEEGRSEDSENYASDDNPGSNSKETLPPYTERDRASLGDRSWDIHRMIPGRNRDVIQLNILPSASQTEST